jgi:ubiquinone/menaquinone biosynthesis C-methylase UbiE
MSIWGNIFAATYDRIMSGVEKNVVGPHRRDLLAHTHGRVLEIGGGTGANLPYWPDAVTEVVATEPEEPMARRYEAKLSEYARKVTVVRAPAEALPLRDGEFDFVVSTLVLCTVSDPAKALSEVRRVLKPGGELIFLEHVRSDSPGLAKWQNRLNGVQRRVGHGCNCNRDTVANIKRAGFTVDGVGHDELRPAPPIVRPLVFGSARPDS